MDGFIGTLKMIWMLCIGWMPPVLASAVTLALLILFIFLIIKLIGMILDAIPFF